MTRVSIERHITQVADGTAYKGHVKIGETTLEYGIEFAIPIPNLDAMAGPQDLTEARRAFQITVKKAGAEIVLTDDEWGFFFSALGMFAVEFYHLPQTRTSNESPIMRDSLQGERDSALGEFSDMITFGIGMTNTGAADFDPALCAMLNAPKFDCKLAA